MNNVSVAGNLIRDPELRYTPQGQAVTRFSLAVNRAYTNRSGERVATTDYFNVNAWGNLGENVAESLKKGNHVVVSGRLQSRTYETEDGSKRTAVEIQAEEVAASLRWSKVQIEPSTKQIAQALDAEVVAEAPAIRATETAPQVAPVRVAAPGQVTGLTAASFPAGVHTPAVTVGAQPQPTPPMVPAMAPAAGIER